MVREGYNGEENGNYHLGSRIIEEAAKSLATQVPVFRVTCVWDLAFRGRRGLGFGWLQGKTVVHCYQEMCAELFIATSSFT